jgi:tetratricopeptide (TPR) repeat protein
MSISKTDIQYRQHYYQLGRKYEDESNLPKAIEAYKEYSNHLAYKDKHIPHQWISKFYYQIGNIEESLFHLEVFAKGCTPPKAAELYKEIGAKYIEINEIDKARTCLDFAIEKDPNIGVKKLLDDLKNR